jgi:hypothetical protein
MQPKSFASTAVLVAAALSTAATAGPLAPGRPSDLVTLRSSGAACGVNTIGRALDLQQNPDGTEQPFAIPARKVLVVTGFDWAQGITGAPGKAEVMFLHSQTPSGVIWPMVTSHADGSADGRAGASVAVTGVVFREGQTLCFSANTGNIGSVVAQVHGFLAKDR